jgi:hypothetical protein
MGEAPASLSWLPDEGAFSCDSKSDFSYLIESANFSIFRSSASFTIGDD